MTFATRRTIAGIAAGLVSVSGLVRAGNVQPQEHELISAVNQYLVEHGDLCVGKFTWPRVVTAQDRQNRTNDAVQLPVLERLGLVESTEVSATAAVKSNSGKPAVGDTGESDGALDRQPASAGASVESDKIYSLTDKGRRYYLKKTRVTLGAHDQSTVHDEDLCVARLSLDKVVRWSTPEQVRGHFETLVHYTYHIKTADWMDDPQARQAFPVVDRIIRHQQNMLMSVTVQLQGGKWKAVLPDARG